MVALSWTRSRPAVASCIVGARNAQHAESTRVAATQLELRKAEMEAIEAVIGRATAPPGAVYALERDRTSKHGVIMRCVIERASITLGTVEWNMGVWIIETV